MGSNNAIMDALIRFRRMQGYDTLWQPGTDHAGIATQMLVERNQDSKPRARRHDLGREEIPREKSGSGRISPAATSAVRSAASARPCDWSRERFTMDDGLSKR